MEQQQDLEQKKKKRMLIIEIIILILMLIGLIILGYFTYCFYVPKPGTTISPTVTPRPSSVSSSPTSSCASILTNTDKDNISLWKTYTNSKYNYSFKYPQTWTETSESSTDQVVMKDRTEQFRFRFMAASVSISEAGYRLISNTPVTVACVETTQKEFRGSEPGGENMYILSVEFKKNGTDFRIPMDYVNRGASMTGDIVDAYNLILKTVEFK